MSVRATTRVSYKIRVATGRRRLDEAATAFRLVIEEWSRAPSREKAYDVAAVRANLGTVLVHLGASEPGASRLEEAVSALRLAVDEFKLHSDDRNFRPANKLLTEAEAMLAKRHKSFRGGSAQLTPSAFGGSAPRPTQARRQRHRSRHKPK